MRPQGLQTPFQKTREMQATPSVIRQWRFWSRGWCLLQNHDRQKIVQKQGIRIVTIAHQYKLISADWSRASECLIVKWSHDDVCRWYFVVAKRWVPYPLIVWVFLHRAPSYSFQFISTDRLIQVHADWCANSWYWYIFFSCDGDTDPRIRMMIEMELMTTIVSTPIHSLRLQL